MSEASRERPEWPGAEVWSSLGQIGLDNMTYLQEAGFSDDEAAKITLAATGLSNEESEVFLNQIARANGYTIPII